MQVVMSYCGKLGTETEQKVNKLLHYVVVLAIGPNLVVLQIHSKVSRYKRTAQCRTRLKSRLSSGGPMMANECDLGVGCCPRVLSTKG